MEYREVSERTIICTPNTNAWLHDSPLPTSLLYFARQKYEYPPAGYKAQKLRDKGKRTLKYYTLYNKRAV